MHWSILLLTSSQLFLRNDLVRCGSFFPFREKIFYKRSELFAIHFSATSTGLDTTQNQNQKQAKWKCSCIRELHNVLLRRYDRYLFFLLKKIVFPLIFLMPLLPWILQICFHLEDILSIYLQNTVWFCFRFLWCLRRGTVSFPFWIKYV